MKPTPGDDALRFLRVGRTQVRDLRRLELCQLRFPAQDPKKIRRGGGVINTRVSLFDTVPWSSSPYSRTADAESVVLNFAKVLTYSRVLLYTLREVRRKKGVGGVDRGG